MISRSIGFDLDGYADICGNQVGIEIVPHQFDKFLRVQYQIVSVQMIVK